MSETSLDVPAESVSSPEVVLDPSLEAMPTHLRASGQVEEKAKSSGAQRVGSHCSAVYPERAVKYKGQTNSRQGEVRLEPKGQMDRERCGMTREQQGTSQQPKRTKRTKETGGSKNHGGGHSITWGPLRRGGIAFPFHGRDTRRDRRAVCTAAFARRIPRRDRSGLIVDWQGWGSWAVLSVAAGGAVDVHR